MSTSKTGDRKSANFTLEDFEKQWSELTKSISATQNGQASGAEIKAPVMKVKQQEKDKVMPTVTQTDTGNVPPSSHPVALAHTPPVTATRSDNPKKLNFSGSVKSADGGTNSPRKREKFADSPRRGNITPRATEKRSSNESRPTTPRDKDEGKSSATNDSSARKFRKEVSRKFTDIKLNLSGLSEKISAGLHSPPASPASGGRVSPSKISPRKKSNNLLSDVPIEMRNQAAKAYLKFQEDPAFMKADPKRQSILLSAKMIAILSSEGISFDEKKIQALIKEAETRSQNARIDTEIDFTKEPYPDHVKVGAGKFITKWKADGFDKGEKFHSLPSEEKAIVDKSFMPTFIADYYRAGVSHELQLPDGTSKPFDSLIALANYLNQNKNDYHRSRYISNVTSQNIVTLLHQWTCGGLSGTTSPIKLYDGRPLIPRGRSEQRFIYKAEADGTIVVKVQVGIFSDNLGNAKRASQLQNDGRDQIFIDEDAKLTISTTLRFDPDDEWTIDNPRLVASGWNLPAER